MTQQIRSEEGMKVKLRVDQTKLFKIWVKGGPNPPHCVLSNIKHSTTPILDLAVAGYNGAVCFG